MTLIQRLLFSAEFLTTKQVLEKKVVDLLAKTDTYLALKVSENDLEGSEFREMLHEFNKQGIGDHFIPWPMLPVEEGYYANELTADNFSKLVIRFLNWYKENNFQLPMGILIDLEPSVDMNEVKQAEKAREENVTTPGKKKAADGNLMNKVGKILDMIDENMDEDRLEAAARRFQQLEDQVHKEFPEVKVIAVALPLAYEDIFDGKLLVQDFMTVPITHPACEWDMINFMIFNTDYVAATKGVITNEEYRHLLYSYAKEFVERWGPEKASITLGITNVGIQDVRAVQTDPELYRLEASVLLAAGMTDVGIYALDGVLEQPNPEEWIMTVKKARDSDFVVNPIHMEFAEHIRKVFQVLDQLTPTLKYLVDSGKVMDILRAFTS